MTDTEEFTKILIDRALKNEHTKFNYLRSLPELFAARQCKKALNDVIKSFNNTAKKVYLDYLDGIKNNTDRIDLLVSYKQINKCIDFYKKEAEITKDIIKEYKCYLKYGHLFKSVFLNYYRPNEDLMDWRKLPIRLF